MAVMTAGRRCPNAALPGLALLRPAAAPGAGPLQHQPGGGRSSPLTDEEVATLADGDADEAAVKAIVEKAESQFDESAEAEEPEPEASVEEAAEAEEARAEEQPEAEPPASARRGVAAEEQASSAAEEDGGAAEDESGGEPRRRVDASRRAEVTPARRSR